MSERDPGWFERAAVAAESLVQNPSGLQGVLLDGGYLCSGCAVRGDHACDELEHSPITYMVGLCCCELCVPEWRRPRPGSSVVRKEDLELRVRMSDNRQATELAECMRSVAAELKEVVGDLHRGRKAAGGLHGTRNRLRRLAADLERRADAT